MTIPEVNRNHTQLASPLSTSNCKIRTSSRAENDMTFSQLDLFDGPRRAVTTRPVRVYE
ncbi:MAG: hypothetical protein WCC26_07610 [Terracidiphilus sp.]